LLLCAACSADPGTSETQGSEPQQVQENHAPQAAARAPKALVEEPGVHLSTMSARNSSIVAIGEALAAEGDEYATKGEMTVKGQFRPELVVGSDQLRSRAQEENWK